MAVAIVTSPDMLLHDPGPGHPERPARLKAVLDTLEEAAFAERLLRVAASAADAFRPDFVLVSAGFDAHKDDPTWR